MSDEQDDPVEAAENTAAAGGNAAFAERLRHQAAQIRTARAEASKLRAELDGISKSHVPSSELEKLRGQIESERSTWAAERAVYQIGITDPEAIELAQLYHQKLPTDARPALADWLRGLRDEPGKAPKALQPFFTPQPAQSSGNAAEPATRKAPAPVSAATSTTASGAVSGELSVDQVRQIMQRAKESGDWSEWDRYFPRK